MSSKQVTKRALSSHCSRGHEMTPENTKIVNKGNGRTYRKCKACKAEDSRKNRSDKKTDVYERPSGSRMQWAISKGVFGDAMTREEIMRNRK
jgi:hypothetical protein